MNDANEQELVTAADIARRLGVTPQRIRQLARDGRLPPPVGTAGRNKLWGWDSIADWAIATGRIDGENNRPSTQAWGRQRPAKFTRVIDCVVPWGHGSKVHARVWQPNDGGMRPVVLLGELDDNEGRSVTNGIEAAATTVAAQLLGPGGLHADWYQYWPHSPRDDHEFHSVMFTVTPPSKATGKVRGSRRRISQQRARLLGGELRDPKWTDIERESLEGLVGQEIEVYPTSVYRTDVVARFAMEGTFAVEWDPTELKRDVDSAMTLLTANDSTLSREAVLPIVQLLTRGHEERVAENVRTARAQPRGLAVELRPYEPSADDRAALSEALGTSRSTAPRPRDLVAHQQELRRWLATRGSLSDQLLLVAGSYGLAWLEPWEAGLDDEALVPGSQLASAIRHADGRVSTYLYEKAPNIADQDFPIAVPSEILGARGRWARRYLETVSWWGPRAEDQLRYRRLRAHLDEDARITSGYDPWGRLVLKTAEFLVTEWPVGPPTMTPPDEAMIVGDASARANNPVFLELPDGRLDLLPAPANRSGGTAFTWGYSGGGPSTFAAAICQLVSSGAEDPEAAKRIYDYVVRLKGLKLGVRLGDMRILANSRAPELPT